LPRDFSGANLDRTFEQNRFRLVPEQRGETTLKIAGKALALLRNPLSALKLTQAELQREAGQNLTASLVLRYDSDGEAQPALHKMALPLWIALGPGQFQGGSDKNAGHLALVWEDARTRYTLRLPYDSVQSVELEASDRQGLEHVTERQTATLAQDRRERKQRIDAGKPFVRLERALELIELGWKRSQVQHVLPAGQAVLKRDLPGAGLVVTFRGDPAQRDSYVMRQMFIRFDRADRVAEVRVRYVDGPSAGTEVRWMTDLLAKIKKRAGAPIQEPSPWAKLWTDLPPQKPAPVLYRWQDDITVLVYQRDAAGVELALRDWSTDPDGSPPPPWEHLPRGLANLQLGTNRQQLLQKWGIAKPVVTDDGALVIRPPQGSPFDAFLIWFENDQAARIVARHVPMGANLSSPSQWAQALTEAWGRELATLGWPRRQDVAANDIVQSLGWHDDRTRMRIFWQESDTPGPPRVFTEWEDLIPTQDYKVSR
jgi:hypothetical protein